MFAIRSFKIAAGSTVDGVFYPHLKWVLQDGISDTVFAACESKNGKAAILEIIEVDDEDDEALQPFGIVTEEAKEASPVDLDGKLYLPKEEKPIEVTATPTARRPVPKAAPADNGGQAAAKSEVAAETSGASNENLNPAASPVTDPAAANKPAVN